MHFYGTVLTKFMHILYFSVGRINGAFALSSGKETIRRDVEAARILFRQMNEHLSKLETKVSMLI